MKNFRQLIAGASLAALALGGSGCLSSRVLKSVIQAGDKNVTMVQTVDTFSFIVWPVRVRQQFWKCSEQPGSITCQKSCTTKDSDLTCPDTWMPGSPVPSGGASAGNSVK